MGGRDAFFCRIGVCSVWDWRMGEVDRNRKKYELRKKRGGEEGRRDGLGKTDGFLECRIVFSE